MSNLTTGIGYVGTFDDVSMRSIDDIVGQLLRAAAHRIDGATEHLQARAWAESIGWTKAAIKTLMSSSKVDGLNGLCFEYEIPRRNYRIDCVVLLGDLIIPIEFKSATVDRSAIRQVEDYGLELATFHSESRTHRILPIVCSSSSSTRLNNSGAIIDQNVHEATLVNPGSLAVSLEELQSLYSINTEPVSLVNWVGGQYSPTPTIIEAASSLFRGHTVDEITRSDASAADLQKTILALERIVEITTQQQHKAICFITGVPGAGKTLAGLSAVHGLFADKSVFLSGNGPLVKVLAKSLENDLYAKSDITRGEAERRASTFISNVHNWLTEYVERDSDRPPHENVVVFDEAQRAWDRRQSKNKFGRDFSEPEGMLRIMDRHESWCVLVALVGGGQEINTGEAGLGEWGRALNASDQEWVIHAPPQALHGDSSTSGSQLFDDQFGSLSGRVHVDKDLHLSVSQRTFRNSHLNSWVESVLANDSEHASQIMELLTDYPVMITRSLPSAKSWLRGRSRGWRRSGIVASSGAKRLRAQGVTVDEPISAEEWFLKPHGDVRSSNQLEVPATEFAIQGLELDWVAVCWGADLRHDSSDWTKWQFRGANWQSVRAVDRLKFIANRYRVLLTRAREGLVIFVPDGDEEDDTRPPSFYDHTYRFLLACGAKPLETE